jgi:triphosphoribosyl-dephospho-CoA synthetase
MRAAGEEKEERLEDSSLVAVGSNYEIEGIFARAASHANAATTSVTGFERATSLLKRATNATRRAMSFESRTRVENFNHKYETMRLQETLQDWQRQASKIPAIRRKSMASKMNAYTSIGTMITSIRTPP